ncbi:MAG: atpE-A [Chlamydiales bacterium]|jgi:V/A-type H+-transporting ATPase subunit E|nr:atpE-A [Chlamydiales bacterium]
MELLASKDKVQQICDQLRQEALEPARREAEEIVKQAQSQAQQIVQQAEADAEKLKKATKDALDKDKQIFETSLAQSYKKTLDMIKQAIEKELFNPNLSQLIKEQSANPQIISKLITAIVEAIQKGGIRADMSAYISKNISAEEINKLLVPQILNALREKSVAVGSFQGGAQVRWHDKNLTLDISDEVITSILSEYIAPSFRNIIFNK